MKTSIKIRFLRRKGFLTLFILFRFGWKPWRSTWNRKICSPAATLVRHLLALGTAAVFSFLSPEQNWGEESPPVPRTPASSEVGGSSRWGGSLFPSPVRLLEGRLQLWWRLLSMKAVAGKRRNWKVQEGILQAFGLGWQQRQQLMRFRHVWPRSCFQLRWGNAGERSLVMPFWWSWVHQLPRVWRWLLVWTKWSIWGNSCQITALMPVVNLLLLEREIWSICFLHHLVVQGIMEENRKPGLLSEKIWLEFI